MVVARSRYLVSVVIVVLLAVVGSGLLGLVVGLFLALDSLGATARRPLVVAVVVVPVP